MAEKATLYLENNKGMILDFTRSPQACDVYDFDGNLISGGGGGGSLLHCSVTFINNTGNEQTIKGIIYATENNALSNYPTTPLPDGTTVFDVYYSEDISDIYAEVTVENCTVTASNEINCTLDSSDDGAYIVLTNHENPSSITLTVTE